MFPESNQLANSQATGPGSGRPSRATLASDPDRRRAGSGLVAFPPLGPERGKRAPSAPRGGGRGVVGAMDYQAPGGTGR